MGGSSGTVRGKFAAWLCAAGLCLGLAGAALAAGGASHAPVWPGGKALKQRLALGKKLYAEQCLPCHSIGGDENDIKPLTRHVATVGMEAYITGQGRLFDHMPLFEGTAKDKRALAEYITIVINKRKPDDVQMVPVKPLRHEVPPFDPAKDAYVLLAWNTLGMKCITDADAFFSFLPPGNAFNAVLVKRGPKPVLVSQGVELSYEVQDGFKNPSAHVDLWKFAPSLLGKELPLNVSASGKGMAGTLAYNEKTKLFEAAGIPVTPFSDDGSINPYPLFTMRAKDSSGALLAQTRFVAPVGSEMGCRSCHGGPWRKNGVSGVSAETAKNILAVHDKRSGTQLLAQAEKGKPVLCQSCHPDPLLNAPGDPKRLNLPAAIHGFHANYLTGQGEVTCSRCHPDSPTGVTRCLRDNHQAYTIGCSRCHGLLEDHTISLLKGELNQGKARAASFMEHLKPQMVKNADAVKARSPWLQEPDCSTCHTDGKRPDRKTSMAFNVWVEGPGKLFRAQKDAMGSMPCIGCHGAPHATYVAQSDYGKDRDNIQPVQYMGFAGVLGARGQCVVCHTQGMKADRHHPVPVMKIPAR
ncbi:Cytochrome C oxidase, cbb3-type, subunit III [Humidesulfovibrio mexicanus]|uniref:Cytochrome C oxidase, cbb3-type, subunit III n=1 Tax=Humidesulfovibrio mexicanus TaxID=147047 RepID=A0A238Y1W7_9BACT|nr:cytochrome c [Humidesulfovibrio mexicanus]SNR65195.1 Cytochrome C oxidase, cbb3-type, subunit III [Humidesulfovibrio mexicanus]